MDEYHMTGTTTPPRRRSGKMGSVLLVLLLLVATGVGVWYWQQRELDSLQTKQISQSANQNNFIDPADESKWNEIYLGPINFVENVTGGLSFKLPTGWTTLSCGGNEILVAYVAPTIEDQALCATEKISPIFVTVQPGDNRDSYAYVADPTTYKDAKTEVVKVDGKDFQLNTAKVAVSAELLPPVDSTITSYVLFDSGVTYAATYVRQPNDKTDLSDQFKTMIEKTLVIRGSFLIEPD